MWEKVAITHEIIGVSQLWGHVPGLPPKSTLMMVVRHVVAEAEVVLRLQDNPVHSVNLHQWLIIAGSYTL